VNREETFTQSHQPYAVDLASLGVEDVEPGADGPVRATVRALWFRRRRARHDGPVLTVACYGLLWDYQDKRPADARAFLAAHADGRYGGSCRARWDGTTLWTVPSMTEPVRAKWFERLSAMLASYPAVPDGYDGWWTFRG